MRKLASSVVAYFSLALCVPLARGAKPPLTLDDFFNAVQLRSVQISPDGRSVVVETARPDWAANRFRNDLWLYRPVGAEQSGRLVQLTQSGHDSAPQWSPDGLWIAFFSDRPASGAVGKERDKSDDEKSSKDVAQVYVISLGGGEPFPVTSGDEEVHAFTWSADSQLIFFATRDPWTKAQKEANKKEWNDVNRFREAERGDTLFSADVASIMTENGAATASPAKAKQPVRLASTPYRASWMGASPDGHQLAFTTESRSERQESREPYGIYVLDLPAPSNPTLHLALQIQDATRRSSVLKDWASNFDDVQWSPDGRHIFFSYGHGAPEGPYQDPQTRIYAVDVAAGKHKGGTSATVAVRWASHFTGSVNNFTVTPDGGVFVAGMLGTEVGPYIESSTGAELVREPGWAGRYEHLSAAVHSHHVAFIYSSLQRPPEVYLADGPDHLEQAGPITAFNQLFTERELPQGKPYRWTADDGSAVEGMLIYPPGQFEAPHLPTFTFIHGGPAYADGNHFEAVWYQWAALAATQGWLVFEPNYRGSVGYGDAFALGIIPHVVSRPGKDILEGVNALVKDGLADPARLTLGGYSYGGYMTNWLITQTKRFKAAVTGAGGVEHVANWGNDDCSFEDAYSLGGLPWEAESNYNAEAAIWQIGKVTTPTHIVAGADDITVYVGEDYLLERALYTRHVPTRLLVFPDEGHRLDKNPWHGKIKVREELKWLEKYGGIGRTDE